jgi:hypothetical protein
MKVRVVPVKNMRRYSRRKWYWPFGPRRMLAVMERDVIFTNPANLHELMKELRRIGMDPTLVPDMVTPPPPPLPANVFKFRKPKK